MHADRGENVLFRFTVAIKMTSRGTNIDLEKKALVWKPTHNNASHLCELVTLFFRAKFQGANDVYILKMERVEGHDALLVHNNSAVFSDRDIHGLMEMDVSRIAKASSEFMYIPTTGTGDDRPWNDKQQILILVGSDSEEDLRRVIDQYTMSSHTDVARRSNEWRGTIKFKKPEVFDVVLIDKVSLETM
jgi:hypothetical protein